MAGLLDKQKQQAGNRPQAGARQQSGDGGGGGMMQQRPMGDDQQQGMEEEETNVTPEEQQAYDEFVTNGMKLIFNEKAMDQVLQAIEGGGDPVQGLGNAVAMVVMRLEDSAEKNGRAEIGGDIKLNAATELLEHMADLAKEAGVHDFSEDEMEAALYRGLDTYREVRQDQGQLPKEELTEDFVEMVEADREGRLGEMVPGIEEYVEKRAPKAGGDQGGGQRRG